MKSKYFLILFLPTLFLVSCNNSNNEIEIKEYIDNNIVYDVVLAKDTNFAKIVSTKEGIDSNIVIPETIKYQNKDIKVISIGENAFSLSNIKNITLSKNINYVFPYCFAVCPELETINFSTGLSYLSDYMFSSCTSLKNINIPSEIYSIGKYAFYGCENLKNIEFHENLYHIDNGAFSNCKSIENINLSNTKIEKINRSTFAYCTNLKSITLPNTNYSIGEEAFYNDINLNSINLDENLLSLGRLSFYNCSSLSSLNLPDNLTTIHSYALSNCKGLTKLFIPKSVTYLGEGVFYNDTNLKLMLETNDISEFSLNFNCELPYVIGAKKDKELFFTLDNFNYGINNVDTDNEYVTLLSVVDKTLLTTDLNIPETITYNNKEYKIKEIGPYIFDSNDTITNITLNSSLLYIDSYAFSNMKNLKTVTITGTTTNDLTLGFSAFENDYNLTTFTLANNPIALGEYAFNKCKNLTNFDLTNVKQILYSTFAECYSLGTSADNPFKITNKIEYINTYAFLEWSTLKTQYIEFDKSLISSTSSEGNITLTIKNEDSENIILTKKDDTIYYNNAIFNDSIITISN